MKYIIGAALLVFGAAALVVAIVKFPSEQKFRDADKENNSDEAYEVRSQIDRRASWKSRLIFTGCGSLALGIVVLSSN